MELPAPGQAPSKAWLDEFKALPTHERLTLTVKMVERLQELVTTTLTSHQAIVEPLLSKQSQSNLDRVKQAAGTSAPLTQALNAQAHPVPVALQAIQGDLEARLALGDEAAAKLHNIAMALAPEETLDQLDQSLSSDQASESQAQQLLTRLRLERLSK